jgi:hypothetical protein
MCFCFLLLDLVGNHCQTNVETDSNWTSEVTSFGLHKQYRMYLTYKANKGLNH